MSAQHTPGRLEAERINFNQAYLVADVDGKNLAIALVMLGVPGGPHNLRRLVACWNACEGIPTDVLEECKVSETLWRQLTAQRDELLEALEKIAGFTLSQFMGPHDMALECVTVACAAIAKVEGGAA